MAEAVVDILIRARQNTGAAFRRLKTDLQNLQSNLGKVNDADTDDLSKNINDVTTDVSRLDAAVEGTTASVKRLGSTRLGNLGAGFRKLGVQAGAASTKLRDVGENLNRSGQALRGAGLELATFGAALLAVPILAVTEYAKLEEAIANVDAIISRVNADGSVTLGFTPRELEDVTETIKELGRTTKFTATEVAGGFQFLAQAGLTVADQLAAIGPSLQLAAAGNLDLAQAADIATNAQTALGLASKDIPRVVDSLAFVASNANTNVSALGDGLKKVATAGASLGIEVEELTAILGTYGNAGISGAEAGTQLRRVITALASETPKAGKALERLGVKVKDGNKDFRGLSVILRELGEANINFADSVTIFGQYSAAAALGVIAQGDLTTALTEGAKAAQGFAEKVALRRLDSLPGDITRLSSAFSGLRTALGDGLNADVREFTQQATEIIGRISKWVEENEDLVNSLIKTAAQVGTIVVVVGTALIAIGALRLGIGSLLGLLGRIVPAIILLVDAFYAIATAATVANGAIAAFIGIGASTLGVALGGLAAGFLATVAAVHFFGDELADAAESMGLLNRVTISTTPVVQRTKKQMRDFAKATQDLADAAEQANHALGGEFAKDFTRELTVLQAKVFTGNITIKDAIKVFTEYSDAIKKVANAIKEESSELTRLYAELNQERLTSARAAKDVEIAAAKESATAQKGEITRLTREIAKAAKDRERILTDSAKKQTDIQREGTSAQLDIETRLRENRRSGFTDQKAQADVAAEAQERLSRAFLTLLKAERSKDSTAAESSRQQAQADIARASSLIGQVKNQKDQKNLLKELGSVQARQTQTALALNEKSKQAALAKAAAELKANEAAKVSEQAKFDATKKQIAELLLQKEQIGQDVEINVETRIEDSKRKLDELKSKLSEIRDKEITITVNTKPGVQSGGVITTGLATGGPVRRLGLAHGGRVPTVLEDGEFIVPPKTARKHASLLGTINNGSRSQVSRLMASSKGISRGLPSIRSSEAGKLFGYGGGDRRPRDLRPGTFVVRKERTKQFLPLLRSLLTPKASASMAGLGAARARMGGSIGAAMGTSQMLRAGGLVAAATANNPSARAPASQVGVDKVTDRVALDFNLNSQRVGTLTGDRSSVDRIVTAMRGMEKSIGGGRL
jgi:TP901 family phage tail tape measure protein